MNTSNQKALADMPMGFMEELRQQRWDDHRYYHHSRVNQSLHLLSSVCFIATYALLLINPSAAALLGWLFAMCSRQIGHFFFEPDSYDSVNHATNAYKEEIKVGYNLSRKRVLLGIWAISPLILWLNPGVFGLLAPYANGMDYLESLSVIWLVLGAGAVVFRTIQLCFIRNPQTGLVWALKILTDPFNDFRQYMKAPLHLMKGELIDPMSDVRQHRLGDPDEHSDEQSVPVVITS
jgi:hypothetical protein